MKQASVRERREFDETFKREAVGTQEQTARELVSSLFSFSVAVLVLSFAVCALVLIVAVTRDRRREARARHARAGAAKARARRARTRARARAARGRTCRPAAAQPGTAARARSTAQGTEWR